MRDVPPEEQPDGGYPLTPGRWHGEQVASAGYDCLPHGRVARQPLDLTVAPDRTWRWKDERSFADKTGHPAYWTGEQAVAIRAEGALLARRAQAREFPFDDRWCDFRPPAAWQTPPLP